VLVVPSVEGDSEVRPMSLEHDVRAARLAVDALTAAVDGLRRHYGEHVDIERLVTDTDRVGHDLDLLVGREESPHTGPMQMIPDEDYPPEFWADADDEGVGRP
jgi:hypothetical protein